MDDALLVRRFQRLGDLFRNGQHFIERHSSLPRRSARGAEAGDALGEVLALNEFHHERADGRLP